MKDNKTVEITITDKLNKKEKKYTAATLHMYDIPRYKEYLEKVEEQKKRLDKEYLAKVKC